MCCACSLGLLLQADDVETCAICLEGIKPGHEQTLDCSHVFHRQVNTTKRNFGIPLSWALAYYIACMLLVRRDVTVWHERHYLHV